LTSDDTIPVEDQQVPVTIVKAKPHYIFKSTNSQIHIGTFKTYLTYDYFKIVDPDYKVYVKIDVGLAGNAVRYISLIDACFAMNINQTYSAYGQLPQYIKDLYAAGGNDGIISIEPQGVNGVTNFKVTYWNMNRIYFSNNKSPYSDNSYWSYITMQAAGT
jgi:hypothetical protein